MLLLSMIFWQMAKLGMKNIIDQSGAILEGVGIVIEKGFQDGSKLLREAGINSVISPIYTLWCAYIQYKVITKP